MSDVFDHEKLDPPWPPDLPPSDFTGEKLGPAFDFLPTRGRTRRDVDWFGVALVLLMASNIILAVCVVFLAVTR